jgi:glycosyltransferase involved in cell wall biosynthesis/GT2 family glycosyltransferase
MRVSVVICTLNRAQSLIETLDCLRYQSFQDFEVVVVNGPSTDDTVKALEPWMDRIRLDDCPVPNLSVSRNIGIRASAGDIIAFIDDDALPEFDWLNQALVAFDDDGVAGVGGIVFDHTGMKLQYKYSAANRFAETDTRDDRPYDELCFPGSFQVPYLQGTNALVRRDALLRIGGFDETFDYYLDETDVCVRLIDSGYSLKQLANAPVHHKFLPSSIRDHQRLVTNWWPIMKNQAYFSYRHALGPFSEYDIQEHSRAFLESRVDDARMHELAGRLPKYSSNIAAITCAEALRVGMQLGFERRDLRLGPVTWEAPEFARFPTLDSARRRKITLVSSGYVPNMTGGIARFFSDLAPALARRGHEVRVITRATGPATVDLEDGVWVHRIESPSAGSAGVAPQVLEHINDFATAVVGEVERIGEWSLHDVVYGPLWDVEILGVLHRLLIPLAIQVATPLAVAGDLAGHLAVSESANEMRKIIALEHEVLNNADLFHANSAAVEHTIAVNYPGIFDPNRWSVVHLGLVDHAAESTPKKTKAGGRSPAKHKHRLTVFFVGRFEIRKGIDTFLEAVAEVAPDFPDVDFVAAGEDRPLAPGLDPYGEHWRATVADEPWADRVRFVGQVTDEELHRLYAASDVVVLPSRYESFGLVMVEAMMHGKALISCDTSGIRDVVRNGTDGVLVEPGDSKALAYELRELLRNPQRRAELGAAGRRRFLDAFQIDRFAERFDHFLSRVEQRDEGRAATADGVAIVAHRGSVGRLQTRLRAGDHIRFAGVSAPAARVGLIAYEPSVIAINDRVIEVSPDAVRRVDVPTGDVEISVTVLSGEVTVGGIVSISEERR